MLALRVFCLMTVMVTFAQSDDIYQRLRRFLGSSGEGELASEALAKKNFALVEEILRGSKASSNADRAELLSLQGAVEFLDGEMAPAVAAFHEAAKLSPLNDGDSFTFAMALVKLGDDAQARSVLTDLAEKHPDRAIYLYWLGKLDYDQRRYEEAVEKLGKATKLDPQSARAWDSLGLAFDMEGRLEQALRAFEKAVNLNRSGAHPSPWPPHDLGYLLLRMERPTDAETALRESLRYDQKLARAHYHLGRVLEKEGRSTEAIEQYIAAVSLDATSSDVCYSLAMLYRRLNRETDAQAMFFEWKKRRQASQSTDSKSPEEPQR